MKRIGTAELTLEMHGGVLVHVEERLGVALDCVGCRRRLRTVLFDRLGASGRCTPTGHEFNGVFDSILLSASGVQARFIYSWKPFRDSKYPDERRYGPFEPGAPGWVRLGFTVRCTACGVATSTGTQTNLGRPWRKACGCGALLYVDSVAPRLTWAPFGPE